MLSFENRSLRDVASFAPYDAVAIVVNGETYGGGGIFNLYATVAARSRWAEYIFVHELGHSVAALADEYFTSEHRLPAGRGTGRAVGAERHPSTRRRPSGPTWSSPARRSPPRGPRSSSRRGPRRSRTSARPSASGTGRSARWTSSSLQQQKEETALLSPLNGPVGAFEGANYEPAACFRAQADCIMFSRDPVPFCAVCRRTLDRVLDLYATPAAR